MENIKEECNWERQLDVLLLAAILLLIATSAFHGIILMLIMLHACLNIYPTMCKSKLIMKGELSLFEMLELAGIYAQLTAVTMTAISGIMNGGFHQTAVYIFAASLIYSLVLKLDDVKKACQRLWNWIVDRKEGAYRLIATVTIIAVLIAGVQNSTQEKEVVHMNNGISYEYSETNNEYIGYADKIKSMTES